jgi:hypothetical protein
MSMLTVILLLATPVITLIIAVYDTQEWVNIIKESKTKATEDTYNLKQKHTP